MNMDFLPHEQMTPPRSGMSKTPWVVTFSLLFLFVGGLIYLKYYNKKHDKAPVTTAMHTPAPITPTQQPTTEKEQQQKFDFYTMLPEMEVQVTPDDQKPKAKKPSNIPKQFVANKVYSLQVASFRSAKDADRLRAELTLKGFDVAVKPAASKNGTWYRVVTGPFDTSQQAELANQKLASIGFQPLLVSHDKA